ncbi:glutamate decarboxylase, partial [Streptomyces sp. C]
MKYYSTVIFSVRRGSLWRGSHPVVGRKRCRKPPRTTGFPGFPEPECMAVCPYSPDMALHQTKDTHARDDGTDVFASALSGQVLPKYRIPDDHSPAEVVYSLLHNELLLDGNAAQNLATFCTTWSDDAVHRLMNECLDKNMIDKDEYPQTAEIEARCVNILAEPLERPARPRRHRL